MLPKLYDELVTGNSTYNYSFLGTLNCCTKCEVKEVRNGAYTLSMETTINDDCAGMLLSQRLIGVKPNPTDNMQLFEIQKTTRTIDGIIKVEAKHIKNLCFQICSEGDLTTEGNKTVVNCTPLEAWELLKEDYIDSEVPFTFTSDITTKADFSIGLDSPETLGNILGGKEGAFTDLWNGEYHWDNLNISFNRERGRISSFQIRYGQNVSDASQIETCEATYSHVLPYGKISNGNKKINFFAPIFEIENSSAKHQKVYMCDCTDFLEAYTVGDKGEGYDEAQAAMTEYAKTYAAVNNLGQISVSISVSFRPLLDDMSSVSLCDTVDVILDNFGTKAKAKIVEVTYDALLERWEKLVIGSPTITVADIILNKRRYIQ